MPRRCFNLRNDYFIYFLSASSPDSLQFAKKQLQIAELPEVSG